MEQESIEGGGGPHLSAAFFCEKVIEDKEGVLSAIRIVDRIIHSAIGAGTPDAMPPVSVALTLLIGLKSGSARGRHDIGITAEQPSGIRRRIAEALTVLFEGEERGANLILNLQWVAEQEGLYWFNVELDGRTITRVPLRVVYQRQETGQSPHRSIDG
jgi:hypothetical protein